MYENKPSRQHLIGLAGVHATCSKLAMHGHNPCIPGVDYGFDIVLDSGIRLQVKTSTLRSHPGFPERCYKFSIREQKTIRKGIVQQRHPGRNWKGLCDFFIFCGLDENRFFVVPCSEMKGSAYVKSTTPEKRATLRAARELIAKGENITEVAYVCDLTVAQLQRALNSQGSTNRFMQYENAWHLLDVQSTAKTLVESAVSTSVLPTQEEMK